MNATSKTRKPRAKKTASKQRFVFFDGPHSDGGNPVSGIERPFWIVKLATDLDEDAKYHYVIFNYDKAKSVAEKIATDQGVEIISSAVTAN